jgi:hypothetical protein
MHGSAESRGAAGSPGSTGRPEQDSGQVAQEERLRVKDEKITFFALKKLKHESLFWDQ